MESWCTWCQHILLSFLVCVFLFCTNCIHSLSAFVIIPLHNQYFFNNYVIVTLRNQYSRWCIIVMHHPSPTHLIARTAAALVCACRERCVLQPIRSSRWRESTAPLSRAERRLGSGNCKEESRYTSALAAMALRRSSGCLVRLLVTLILSGGEQAYAL